MKTNSVPIIAAIGLVTSTMFSQEKFQVAELDQLITKPEEYRGKIVALHGFIGKVTLERYRQVWVRNHQSYRWSLSSKPLAIRRADFLTHTIIANGALLLFAWFMAETRPWIAALTLPVAV